MTTTIKLEDGKYTVIHDNGTNLRALRHGEPWRDLIGDGLVLAMAQRIEQLEVSHDDLVKLVKAAQAILADYLPPDGASVQETVSKLLELLDGPQSRAALAQAASSPAQPDSTKERTDACVAACASIPTYLLFGKNREPNDLGAMIVILRKQRNDLVDALGKIADFAPGYGDVCEIIAKISRAALTKVGAV